MSFLPFSERNVDFDRPYVIHVIYENIDERVINKGYDLVMPIWDQYQVNIAVNKK
jgi:hypothetical protein